MELVFIAMASFISIDEKRENKYKIRFCYG